MQRDLSTDKGFKPFKMCRLTYESVSFDLRVCIVYICFYYFFCPFFPALTILLTVSLTKESLSAFVLSNLTIMK
jgi:hypothetical protein